MNYLGFIGSGNMGGALAKAAAKSVDGSRISLSDNDTKKAYSLASEISATAVSNYNIAQNSKYIFLGVKPQFLESLFEEISPILKQRTDEFVLVSMAAGTSVQKISSLAGVDCPIIRIMPNTPASIGKGMILYCGYNFADYEAEFLDIMKHSGNLDSIPESLIDSASCISGCGPAWVYMFIEALADGGVACGLPRDKAIKYACNTLIGSAELVKSSGKHCGQLKDEVCSPAGTTIAGVMNLEKNAFRSAVSGAVKAAYDRTMELK